MDRWGVALTVYVLAAVVSLIPVAVRLARLVQLLPAGPSFDQSPHFSDEAKVLLMQHWDRIHGTLVFWKTQAARYKAFHTYSLVWVSVSTVLVPLLAQAVTVNAWSRALLTVVGAQAALLLTLTRTFRVESHYKAFRHGESEFYDLYRRLLDQPSTFGATETDQLSTYFELTDRLRRFIRTAETDNLPAVEEIGDRGSFHGRDGSASSPPDPV